VWRYINLEIQYYTIMAIMEEWKIIKIGGQQLRKEEVFDT